ncbi:MAG: hypothetical protein AAF585_19380 [Verrucomicrobiota bacterium]
MRIEHGHTAGLHIVRHTDHVVVSPFPAVIEGGKLRVDAPDGVEFQVLVDGERIVDIEANGGGEIEL